MWMCVGEWGLSWMSWRAGACSRGHMISYNECARGRNIDMHERDKGSRGGMESDRTVVRQGRSMGGEAP